MNQTALHLPRRAEKPREAGVTMAIDGGIPLWYFTDLVSSAAEYIDFVKFGWGTAVVSSDLCARISAPGRRGSPWRPGRAGSPASAGRTARCGSG